MIHLVLGGSESTSNGMRMWKMSWQIWWHKNSCLIPVLESPEEKMLRAILRHGCFNLKVSRCSSQDINKVSLSQILRIKSQ